MKKLLSIATAILMLFVLSTSVFAAEETSVTPDPVTMTKEYELEGGTTTPAEDLAFVVELVSGVEGGVSELPVVSTNNTVSISSSTTLTTDFTVTLPTYTKVGVYTYTITEQEGTTLGVDYDTTPVYMVVTITNSSTDGATDAFTATVAIHKGSATAEKTQDSEFVNSYGLGKLTVTKNVSGNLASNTKKFTIHVTFSGGTNAGSSITYSIAGGAEQTLAFGADGTATLDVELSNGQSVEFTNIPAGVTYTVEEDDKHTEGADSPETTAEGYTVSYTKSDDEMTIKAGDEDTVTVLNEKKTEIDTGINLDSMPYITLLAGVMALAAFMVIRRRRTNED